MKSLIQAVALAVVLVVPAISFAQSDQPVTRAEVTAQLKQLEAAGYKPEASDSTYPAGIQAAEARVAAQGDTTGYGPAANGSSQAGAAAPVASPSMQPPMDGQ